MCEESDTAVLPAATARACLPHWLEAAGWLAGLLSDATAAAMGRLPATPRTGGRRSVIDMAVRGVPTLRARHTTVLKGS